MMFPYCAFFPCSRFVLACSTAATGTCIAACVLRPQITAAFLHRLCQGGGWLSPSARMSWSEQIGAPPGLYTDTGRALLWQRWTPSLLCLPGCSEKAGQLSGGGGGVDSVLGAYLHIRWDIDSMHPEFGYRWALSICLCDAGLAVSLRRRLGT